jgi:hypothetical protein
MAPGRRSGGVDLSPSTLIAIPADASRLQTAAKVLRRDVLVSRRHPVTRAIKAPHDRHVDDSPRASPASNSAQSQIATAQHLLVAFSLRQ